VADLAVTAEVPGGRLRVLMVISRPAGTGDIRYQMIARPLLERLGAVRGQVDLVVLRPPTLDALHEALAHAVAAGEPFQVVHFDGHGALPGRPVGSAVPGGRPGMLADLASEGVLAFERPGGGGDDVAVSKVAAVLKDAGVPVVVLNACQSGAVGKDVEAAIATRLVREGCAAVVAMAYSVYAVAAAEFMAIFYERLFAGDTVSAAVTAGRKRLFVKDLRPSPKGDRPLADWLVPVHYLRRDVSFPQACTSRPTAEPSLEAVLDGLRAPGAARGRQAGSLDPIGVFVGRDELFYQLEVAAQLQKVVVLHGSGGTGKTELAKAFGRWWRATGGVEQPEWVVWHSFEPGLVSFGLDGVIIEIGLQVFGSDFALLDPVERRQAVEQLLAERRLLLIWDNFEAVRSMPDLTGVASPLDEAAYREVKGFLARLATSSKSKSVVLITSRTAEDWLGPVRRISVGGLARDEAVQYAGELLAPYPAAARRRTGRAFGELLEWLGGHPLSMRVILPRLDTTDPLALLDGLRGTAPLPGARDDPDGDRTTSLAVSITYSFAHLASTTRRLLPAVCLFLGVADLSVLVVFSRAPEMPGRFAAVEAEDWRDVLEDAARVGLLTALGAGMYQIHPALPAYLTEQWRAEDPDGYCSARDAANRAFAHAHAVLGAWLRKEIESGDADSAYTVIELQRRTLNAMLGYALEHQLWETAVEIAAPLNYYWGARGLHEEADVWTDRVQIATTGPAGSAPQLDTSAGGLWLFITGAQANRQGRAMRPEDAERTYRQILDMLQAQSPSPRQRFHIASAYHNLGLLAQARGRLDEAEDWYRKSQGINEDLGNEPGVATSYETLGNVAYLRGQLDDAEDWYRKSLGVNEGLGYQQGIAGSYHQLGVVAQAQGRLGEAEDCYRKSLGINEGLGNLPSVALSYHNLGVVAQVRGRLDEAEDWYRKSLGINEGLGNQPGLADSYHNLGAVAQDRGRLDEAEDWYRKSLAIKEGLGNELGIADGYHQLGTVAQAQGRLDEAGDWYRKSLRINQGLGNQPGIASSYYQLGLVAERRGQLHDALDWMVRCVTVFSQFPHPLTGPGPKHLVRLTGQLGMRALETSWQEATGKPLPPAVGEYVSSRPLSAD
jgi:tetratricopeptide (TPR) repeat protein